MIKHHGDDAYSRSTMFKKTSHRYFLIGATAAGVLGLAASAPSFLAQRLLPGGLLDAAHSGAHYDVLSGRLILRDLEIPHASGSIRVGYLSTATGYGLIGAAFAAENVLLKDVAVTADHMTFRAPAVEVANSSLGQKDFAALIDRTNARPLPEVLASFGASSILIAELAVERKVELSRQTYVIRKLALRDIANGKAALLAADGGVIAGPVPEEGSFGAVAGKSLDLAQLARTLGPEPATPDAEPKALLSALTIEKLLLKTGSGSAAFGRLAANDVRVQLGPLPGRFSPVQGALTASDAKFVVGSPTSPKAPVEWTVKTLALTLDAPRDSIPTKFYAAIDGLTIPVPANSTDPNLKNLADLGYTAVVASVIADASWNPQSSDLEIRQLSMNGADFGSISLAGVLGRITKDAFARDKALSQAAFKKATAKTWSLVVENKGLYEHIVAREARKRGKSLEETRRDLSMSSSLTFATMMRDAPAGSAVAAAIGKFVAKPGKLRINGKSKDAAGIVLSSLTDSATAKAVGDKIDVTAVAE